jgi:NhaP-type Na+/H+ or K+/H+ antiporter
VTVSSLVPSAAAPGFHFGDLYAVALLAAGAALLLAVVALSREHGRAFTSATVYLFMGAVASLGLSAVGVGLLDPLEDSLVIERAAELAVVIALFSAGIRLDRRLSLRGWASTVRLIGLAMPLTIGLVALLGNIVMGLSWGAAIILAAALAPTDPVLAGEVQVGPPGEGGEEEPRFALTSEAGLNDGLAFPFVFLGLLVAEPGGASLANWLLADVLYAIVVGTLVGALAGWGLAATTSALREREWLLAEYDGWLAIAGVLVAYGAAEVLGAYGFLAAFAGGLAFRRHEREHEYHQPVHRGIAEIERVSELALVLMLGSTVTLVGLSEPGIGGWALALALLLVIRPAAVLLSFLGSRLPHKERLFIGWFGVRGVGSFYYVAVAIGAGVLSAAESTTIYWTVIACVGLSIILHGLSATPASRGLGLEQKVDS